MKKNLSIFLVFLSITIFAFWGLWNTYFQQDEWLLFGRAINQSQGLPLSFLDFAGNHFWPAGNALWFSLYKIFGFDAWFYSLSAILLHSLVSFLVWKFINGFIKNGKVSFLLTILFTISFPAAQPVLWFAIPVFLFPSIIFLLLFLIYLQKCNEKGILSRKDILILFLLFLISFIFREESMTLMLLLPAYVLLFWKGSKNRLILPVLTLVVIIIVFILARIGLEAINGEHIIYEQGSRKLIILYNLISIPPKIVFQNALEYVNFWWPASNWYAKLAFPWLLQDGHSMSRAVFEGIVFLLSIPLALLVGASFIKSSLKNKKVIIFSIFWILVCSAILAFGGRRLHFLESRYLYLGNIGVILFLYGLFSPFVRINERFRPLFMVSLLIFYFGFIVYFYSGVRWYVNDFYTPIAEQRKNIISQILKTYPKIEKNTIFFVECKSSCLADDIILPFQSGVGQMLLVLYGSKNEKAYAPFLNFYFLWDWKSEGYKRIGDYGFGYFRDFKKMKDVYTKENIRPEDIVSFKYDKSNNKIEDTSQKTRERLLSN